MRSTAFLPEHLCASFCASAPDKPLLDRPMSARFDLGEPDMFRRLTPN